jgi:DNA-binding transcriptional LysR family regulator
MDLNLLRTFVAVFETGSLTRAAETLQVTQP